MEKKKFNGVLEAYLTENYMTCDDYEEMDEMQVMIIQAIKRARARLKAKQIKQ